MLGFRKTGWEDTSSAAIFFEYIRTGYRACDNEAIDGPKHGPISQIILRCFEKRDSRTNFKGKKTLKCSEQTLCD